MDVIAVVGMLAAIVFAFVLKRGIPTWALAIYLFALLVSRGWIGLFVVASMPFLMPIQGWDGEFLDEMLARFAACGIWTAVVLGFLVHRIVTSRGFTDAVEARLPSTAGSGD